MNYYTHVESNRFKVKDPAHFKEVFYSRIGGDTVDLQVFEDGFQFWVTNPYVINPEYDDANDSLVDYAIPDLDIPDIVQPHLRDGQILHAVYIARSSKETTLSSNICVASNVAISWESSEDTLMNLERNLYPRYVKCLTSCHNKETDRWIEEGKNYLAIELIKQRNRWYYLISVKGHKITWSKEYFDGGEG